MERIRIDFQAGESVVRFFKMILIYDVYEQYVFDCRGYGR